MHDLYLLGEAAEPLTGVGERNAVRGVLGLVPAGAEAQFDPSPAHLIDLRDTDRERAGQPERRRADQRAEPDPGGLARQRGQREPGVGRAGQPRATDRQVVVGAEERVEAELLRGLRHAQQVVVARALLGLGEDAQLHQMFRS